VNGAIQLAYSDAKLRRIHISKYWNVVSHTTVDSFTIPLVSDMNEVFDHRPPGKLTGRHDLCEMFRV
jgi:hypothetical protein